MYAIRSYYGVKERPIAYKMGLGFCDHNHERKEALAGYEGMLNFAKEIYATAMSPVWQFTRKGHNNSIETQDIASHSRTQDIASHIKDA